MKFLQKVFWKTFFKKNEFATLNVVFAVFDGGIQQSLIGNKK
jgi:hypothetical protein